MDKNAQHNFVIYVRELKNHKILFLLVLSSNPFSGFNIKRVLFLCAFPFFSNGLKVRIKYYFSVYKKIKSPRKYQISFHFDSWTSFESKNPGDGSEHLLLPSLMKLDSSAGVTFWMMILKEIIPNEPFGV